MWAVRMTWFGWVFVIVTVVENLGFIAEMNKPRKVRTSGAVIVGLILNGLLIWGAVVVGTKA